MQWSAQTVFEPAPAIAPSVASRLTGALPADGVRARVLAALLCSFLVAEPLLAVHFPPITDLPQHVAQIRLFLAALVDPDSGYRIQWFTPYSAAYTVLGVAWALCTPANAGRIAVLLLGAVWTLAVHGLAARRQRSVAAAVLASMLFFNHTLYWGFLSFIAGWLAFVVWFLLATGAAPDGFTWRDAVTQCGAALLLYCSHALWFAFGLGWLVVYATVHRWPARVVLSRLASVAPVAVVAALWYPHLAALGFVSPTVWFTLPLERLSPAWLVDAVLGGIYGPTEYLVAGILIAWVLAGAWQHRGSLRRAVDMDLLWTGVLLIALGLVLPDQYMNTIQFAARWVPGGVILVILAVPAPALLERIQRPLAVAVMAVFCLATTLAWMRFERDELSGLEEALAAVPSGQRVLGLDLVQESAVIKGRPFLQTVAYAQVLHGGRLNTSFAGFAPSLVVYRERRAAPWTPNLEWFAERVRPDDFAYFDYALINGRDEIHAQTLSLPLAAVSTDGRWRLYKVTAPRP